MPMSTDSRPIRADLYLEARRRRRRAAENRFRILSQIFFGALLLGVFGFFAYLARLTWPVL